VQGADKTRAWLWSVGMFAASVAAAGAATLYVDANSLDLGPPHATPKTAARDLPTAVNAAEAGDTVEVAPGT
jgi:hypothetical protein